MISVYSLVEDTPTKDLGKELEQLIEHNSSTTVNTPNVSPSKSPTLPVNPYF